MKRVRAILITIFRPSMASSDGSDENESMTFLLHYPATALITMCSVKLCHFLYTRTNTCDIYWLNFYFNQLIYSTLPEKYSYFIKHELSWFYRGQPAVFLKTFKTIRHKQPHLCFTILHDAEPPQRFCIYLAQKSSIILSSEKKI